MHTSKAPGADGETRKTSLSHIYPRLQEALQDKYIWDPEIEPFHSVSRNTYYYMYRANPRTELRQLAFLRIPESYEPAGTTDIERKERRHLHPIDAFA
jgi:hypothetical protein